MQKNISGAVFRKMVTAGVKNLSVNKQQIDALNVFPVPDGDTGTNMFLTLQSAIKELDNCHSNNFSDVAEAFSKGALRGARGNSGVITSQIFRGFCAVIKDAEDVDVRIFSKALKNGVEVAYNAVTKPKEGTILTVIRGIAEKSIEACKKTSIMEEFMQEVIDHGEVVLKKTPDMLDVLKKAGVVDSGGMGILVVFKGMLKGLLGEEIENVEELTPQEEQASLMEHADITNLADIEFAYCTEFFIINLFNKTTDAAIAKLRDTLESIGDSVLVIGQRADDLIKVHVHTNKPGHALQHALELGELDSLKIENMLEQNRQIIAKYEAEKKEMGMLSICAGIGLSEIFKDLLVDRVIEGGQTMNPSADDIASAVKKVNAENVFVFPNNKNIVLAAEQSKALVENKTIHVIPTRNIPQGIAAALSFDPELTVEENKVNMCSSLDSVKSGQVTYAVRNTNLNGFALKIGDIMALDDKQVLAKGSNVVEVTKSLVKKLVDENSSIVTLYYGEDVEEKDAFKLVEELTSEFKDLEISTHYGGQPIYYYFVSVE